MYDAFERSKVKGVRGRKVRTAAAGRFSPSFGVHHGRIPDPNWPPPEIPDSAKAMQRKSRRVICDFNIIVGGKKIRVHGDISHGGAMFYLPEPLAAKTVYVSIKRVSAKAELLSTSKRPKGYAHHFRFLDENEGFDLWDALVNS